MLHSGGMLLLKFCSKTQIWGGLSARHLAEREISLKRLQLPAHLTRCSTQWIFKMPVSQTGVTKGQVYAA